MRSHISDSRAIPNAGLDTDHRPVITTLATQKKKSTTKRKKQPERINTHKLQVEDVKTQVRNTFFRKLGRTEKYRRTGKTQLWCQYGKRKGAKKTAVPTGAFHY